VSSEACSSLSENQQYVLALVGSPRGDGVPAMVTCAGARSEIIVAWFKRVVDAKATTVNTSFSQASSSNGPQRNTAYA
jgi:hypothetical protein